MKVSCFSSNRQKIVGIILIEVNCGQKKRHSGKKNEGKGERRDIHKGHGG